MFVLLGEQLPDILRGAVASTHEASHPAAWLLAVDALAIGLGLTLLRFIWVWVSLRLTLFNAWRRGEQVVQPNWRLILATSLAGVRGAITLAGILTLPLLMPDGTPFPTRGLAIFLATAVILLSLVIASLGLPRLLKGLELPEEPAPQLEEDLARREAAAAAVAAIKQAQFSLPRQPAAVDIYARAAEHVMGLYQHRLDGDAADRDRAGHMRQIDEAERALRLAGLQAERKTIFNLARQSRISDVVSRKLVREIDLVESRYR